MPRPDPDEPRFIHRRFDRPDEPRVSVVIPSLDGHRGGNVELLLENLEEQTHRPIEVVVAVGLRPAGRARNRGAEKTSGEYLFFIDDDLELRDDETLAGLLRLFHQDPGKIGMTGPTLRLLSYSNDFQRRAFSQIPRLSAPPSEGAAGVETVPDACFLIPRDLYFECGGESETLRGDTSRNLRGQIRRRGLNPRRAEEVFLGSPAPENWDALLSSAFLRGEVQAETSRYRSKAGSSDAADPHAPVAEVESHFARMRDWGIETGGAVRKGHWIRLADEFAWTAGWLSGKLLDLNRNRVLVERGVKAAVGAVGEVRRLRSFPPPPAVRIFTYHRVDDIPGHPLCVTKKEFERQIDYLLDQALLIDFEEAMRTIREGLPITRNRVALAFDDGFRDNFTNALPVLVERGVNACFFLVSERIGSLGEFGWMKRYGAPNYHILDWDQVRSMRDAGMTIGSHTARHERLALLDDAEAKATLEESLETIEKETGRRPKYFAHPYGREGDYGPREIDLLKRAGVEFAFGAHYGGIRAGADPYRLPRIDIDASDSFEIFKSKVHGDFDSVWFWGKRRNRPKSGEAK